MSPERAAELYTRGGWTVRELAAASRWSYGTAYNVLVAQGVLLRRRGPTRGRAWPAGAAASDAGNR